MTIQGVYTDRELRLLQREQEEMFDAVCVIKRDDNASADPDAEIPTIYSDHPCTYWPSRTREEARSGGTVLVRTPAELWVAVGTAIQEKDIVTSITDQLGTERLTRALFVRGIEVLDSHLVIELSGVRQ
jgi:hypothetical protein